MAVTDNLTGAQKDVFYAIEAQLKQWDLGSLADTIADYIKQNYSSDTINILIQDTPAFKTRFAANEARRAKGLPVLSPADYLRTELAYRQVMQVIGLPSGFYDEPSDFQKWLELDVSPNEIQGRVKTAQQLVESADPAWKAQFEQWYSHGEIVAYALDQKRTEDLLEKQAAAAQLGATANQQGVSIDASLGERLAEQRFTQQQAYSGFGQVAQESRVLGAVGKVWGSTFDQSDAINDTFFDDDKSREKKRLIVNQEHGAFSGDAGIGEGSLKTSRGGTI